MPGVAPRRLCRILKRELNRSLRRPTASGADEVWCCMGGIILKIPNKQ